MFKMNQEITLNDLLIFSCNSGNIELIKERLESGADINYQSSNGSTPILAAIKKQSIPVIQLLIEHGANVNCKDNYENTPLEYAIEFKNTEIAELLFNRGAYLGKKASPYAKDWLISYRKNITNIST